MPYRIRTSAGAEQDIEHIYGFIGAATSEHAAAWFRGLRAAIKTLDEMPHRCPVISEDPDARHLLYGNKPHVYRVIFEIDEPEGTVDILNVRHSARSAYRRPPLPMS